MALSDCSQPMALPADPMIATTAKPMSDAAASYGIVFNSKLPVVHRDMKDGKAE